MSRTRRYATNAQRQAAYRQRCAQTADPHTLSMEIPSLPAVPSIPGHRRWKAMLKQATILVERAAAEMETYFDQRSEQWQDSEQAETFSEIMDSTRNALEALQEVQY